MKDAWSVWIVAMSMLWAAACSKPVIVVPDRWTVVPVAEGMRITAGDTPALCKRGSTKTMRHLVDHDPQRHPIPPKGYNWRGRLDCAVADGHYGRVTSDFNLRWGGWVSIAELRGARDEVVSFGIQLETLDVPMTEVTVEMDDLRLHGWEPPGVFVVGDVAEESFDPNQFQPEGRQLEVDLTPRIRGWSNRGPDRLYDLRHAPVEIFYAHPLPIRSLSTFLMNGEERKDARHVPRKMRYTTFGSRCLWDGRVCPPSGTSDWIDRPDADTYRPEVALPLSAIDSFDVEVHKAPDGSSTGGSAMLWVDVYIPEERRAAPPGTYEGMIRVHLNRREGGQTRRHTAGVLVRVDVGDYSLPAAIKSRNLRRPVPFAYVNEHILKDWFVQAQDTSLKPGDIDAVTGKNRQDRLTAIVDRYHLLARRHRVHPVGDMADRSGDFHPVNAAVADAKLKKWTPPYRPVPNGANASPYLAAATSTSSYWTSFSASAWERRASGTLFSETCGYDATQRNQWPCSYPGPDMGVSNRVLTPYIYPGVDDAWPKIVSNASALKTSWSSWQVAAGGHKAENGYGKQRLLWTFPDEIKSYQLPAYKADAVATNSAGMQTFATVAADKAAYLGFDVDVACTAAMSFIGAPAHHVTPTSAWGTGRAVLPTDTGMPPANEDYPVTPSTQKAKHIDLEECWSRLLTHWRTCTDWEALMSQQGADSCFYNDFRPMTGTLAVDGDDIGPWVLGWAIYKHEIGLWHYWHMANMVPSMDYWTDPITFDGDSAPKSRKQVVDIDAARAKENKKRKAEGKEEIPGPSRRNETIGEGRTGSVALGNGVLMYPGRRRPAGFTKRPWKRCWAGDKDSKGNLLPVGDGECQPNGTADCACVEAGQEFGGAVECGPKCLCDKTVSAGNCDCDKNKVCQFATGCSAESSCMDEQLAVWPADGSPRLPSKVPPPDFKPFDGPAASLRLKGLRRAIQDVDLLLLAGSYHGVCVEQLVDELLPRALFEVGSQATFDPSFVHNTIWDENPARWREAREVLRLIIRTKGKTGTLPAGSIPMWLPKSCGGSAVAAMPKKKPKHAPKFCGNLKTHLPRACQMGETPGKYGWPDCCVGAATRKK